MDNAPNNIESHTMPLRKIALIAMIVLAVCFVLVSIIIYVLSRDGENIKNKPEAYKTKTWKTKDEARELGVIPKEKSKLLVVGVAFKNGSPEITSIKRYEGYLPSYSHSDNEPYFMEIRKDTKNIYGILFGTPQPTEGVVSDEMNITVPDCDGSCEVVVSNISDGKVVTSTVINESIATIPKSKSSTETAIGGDIIRSR